MSERSSANPSSSPKRWLTRGVLGIGLASLFSDWGHEAATSILPAFLASLGAPAFALGVIEGVSDGLSSFAKLVRRLDRRSSQMAQAHGHSRLPGYRPFNLRLRLRAILARDFGDARARLDGSRQSRPVARHTSFRRRGSRAARPRIRIRACHGHPSAPCSDRFAPPL